MKKNERNIDVFVIIFILLSMLIASLSFVWNTKKQLHFQASQTIKFALYIYFSRVESSSFPY